MFLCAVQRSVNNEQSTAEENVAWGTSVIIHNKATFDGDKTAFPRPLYPSAGSFTSAAYKQRYLTEHW